MAEVIGLAASVVQLLGCIQQLRTFCKAVRGIPQELQATLDEIEVLQQVISQIATIERSQCNVPGDGGLLASLERCKTTASALEAITTRTITPLNKKGFLRPGSLVRAVLKKEDIKEMKQRLDTAKSDLHLAVTCYNMITQQQLLRMQQEQLSLLKQGFLLPSNQATASYEGFDNSSDVTQLRTKRTATLYPTRRLEELCRLKRCCCACHDTLTFHSRSWPLKFTTSTWFWKTCNKTSCRNARSTSVWFSLTPFGIQKAVCISLDFSFSSEEIRLSPSLAFPRVVRRTSPGFTLLWEMQTGQKRDWPSARQELLQLFASGQASPRDIDPDENTWLEKLLWYPWGSRSREMQFSLLHMLADMGTQINTPGLLYQSLGWIEYGSHLDLLDNLLNFGFDVSEIELPSSSLWPKPYYPRWYAQVSTLDPFFVEWISKNLQDCPGFAGLSPLLEAVLIGSAEEVIRHLSKSALEIQDNLLGFSSLHLAVTRDHHLDSLLNAGANVNARDRHGITPLMYAAASNKSHVAVRLIKAGADLYLHDTTSHRDFFQHAVDLDHWHTIKDILAFLRELPAVNKSWICNWSTRAILRWLCDHNSSRFDPHMSHIFGQLLEWGADPNYTYPEDGTLAHMVKFPEELRVLISNGFTNFNHQDVHGAHPLIKLSSSGSFSLPDPGAINLLIDRGSFVDHQNHNGHASLHFAAKKLKNFSLPFRNDDINTERLEFQSRIINSMRALVEREANPCLGDYCYCYCSISGCTPIHSILKEGKGGLLRQDIWILEYFDIVSQIKCLEISKECLLDILRLLKFQDLELTHTCGTRPYSTKTVFENEEVAELHSEEMELTELLEKEMKDLENRLPDNLYESLLTAICTPMTKAKARKHKINLERKTDQQHDIEYGIDFRRDRFIPKSYGSGGIPNPPVSDTMDLPGYISWVEWQHAQNQKQKIADEEWYEKRVGWISRIRAILEEAEKAASENVAPEPILLVISTF